MLWWQWRRLRQAVETDCDRRVLRSQPDVRRYGRLLLEVADRTRRHALPMAAFAESRSFLERRIRMMTNRQARNRLGWTVALVGALALTPALLLALPAPAPVGVGGVVAWVARAHDVPTASSPIRFVEVAAPLPAGDQVVERAPEPVAPEPVVQPRRDTVPAVDLSAPADSKKFKYAVRSNPARSVDTTKFEYQIAMLDTQPNLINRTEIAAWIDRLYPAELRAAGTRDVSLVQFVVERDGLVDPTTLKVVSSSDERLEVPSVLVVERFRFQPGIYHGRPVRVLVQMPITWEPKPPPKEFSGLPSSKEPPPAKGFQELSPPKEPSAPPAN
jgi:hypothetical protein